MIGMHFHTAIRPASRIHDRCSGYCSSHCPPTMLAYSKTEVPPAWGEGFSINWYRFCRPCLARVFVPSPHLRGVQVMQSYDRDVLWAFNDTLGINGRFLESPLHPIRSAIEEGVTTTEGVMERCGGAPLDWVLLHESVQR